MEPTMQLDLTIDAPMDIQPPTVAPQFVYPWAQVSLSSISPMAAHIPPHPFPAPGIDNNPYADVCADNHQYADLRTYNYQHADVYADNYQHTDVCSDNYQSAGAGAGAGADANANAHSFADPDTDAQSRADANAYVAAPDIEQLQTLSIDDASVAQSAATPAVSWNMIAEELAYDGDAVIADPIGTAIVSILARLLENEVSEDKSKDLSLDPSLALPLDPSSPLPSTPLSPPCWPFSSLFDDPCVPSLFPEIS
jgi:hypothetical protein